MKFYVTFPFNYYMGKNHIEVEASGRLEASARFGMTVWAEKEWKEMLETCPQFRGSKDIYTGRRADATPILQA